MKKFMNSKLSNILFTIFIAFIVVFVIKTYILETQFLKTSNMSPTLNSGDFLLINKLNKVTGYIKNTDIVEYYDEKNSNICIARVIAKPKDSVEIINDDIFINGKKIYEPYILLQQSKKLNNNKWVLDDDEYFVINDDREHGSYNDSRYIGPIKKDYILGVVFFRLYPVDKIGSI